PVEDEAEREGRLVVLADADGIRQLRQPRRELLAHRGDEWCQRLPPGADLRPHCGRRRRVPGPLLQLEVELQQPRQSVRPLERRTPGRTEVRDFGSNTSRRQALGKRRTRL